MHYDYITDNNLINRQKYMYSSFGGKDFLQAYIRERKRNIISDTGYSDSDLIHESLSYKKIKVIMDNLSDNNMNPGQLTDLNDLIKSFEVRKRIYSNSNEKWIPENKNGDYEDYDCYLLFAEVLLAACFRSECLKYVSCLLKLDDTLISIRKAMNKKQQIRLSDILRNELKCVSELADRLGISMEGDQSEVR